MHPVHQTHDGKFNTISGRIVDLYHPTVSMIDHKDIGHALSMICRFGGHLPRHYSVGQHSIFVMNLAKEAGEPLIVQLACLLHDATEAYLGDVIKPLKNAIGTIYKEFESRFEAIIMLKYGIPRLAMEKVKQYDFLALELEFAYFFEGK